MATLGNIFTAQSGLSRISNTFSNMWAGILEQSGAKVSSSVANVDDTSQLCKLDVLRERVSEVSGESEFVEFFDALSNVVEVADIQDLPAWSPDACPDSLLGIFVDIFDEERWSGPAELKIFWDEIVPGHLKGLSLWKDNKVTDKCEFNETPVTLYKTLQSRLERQGMLVEKKPLAGVVHINDRPECGIWMAA